MALAWLKWPCGIASLLLLLPTIGACFQLIVSIAKSPSPLIPFAAGAAVYVVGWLMFIRHWRTTFLSTLEHELTHALFAWLTFHRVVGLKTTWSSGGHMQYLGRGNWLITLAPYFFPTLCTVLLLILAFVPSVKVAGDVLLGAAFAYHVTSTMRETHPGQTDLQSTGYLFALAFLPTANLICHGVVLAYCHAGTGQMSAFLQSIASHVYSNFT